ncbi:DoxX family protein [Pseudomarimonas arenosa]|uniref:DoxX family protein n=1 Tax=Pseudomarimonas arenosa TaxID=2774145 RepID=UPI002FC3C869
MIIRLLTYLLALVFFASGGAKLAALPFELEAFARWGYPLWFMYLTGALEVAGALGLLIPRLSALAAACLGLLMIGAVATHALHAEWPMLALASTIMLLAGWRGWVGRAQIASLFVTRPGQAGAP